MAKKMKIGAQALLAKALLLSFAMMDQAYAGFFHVTPKAPPTPPPPPPQVPELDGAGAIMVIALLASIGAILLGRSRQS